ncbi:MAG TPA: hypothetical protein VG222_16780 [Vicinamibacterales bacterium]|nr:hypothetical protein [Vicinamibacterales bacterium]
MSAVPRAFRGVVLARRSMQQERRAAMSHQIVANVIERLLEDGELRVRFALDPIDTLAELHLRGLPLTSREIDVFVQSDVRLWFGGTERVAVWRPES